MEQMFDRLWPLNRSLTGNGVDKTFDIISEIVDLKYHDFPSGSKVFDWRIPKVWNVNEAYIIDPNGKKICDFEKNNLHLVGYSHPVNKSISLEELKKYLYSLPELPDAIPYITSYYEKRWGFCISHNELETLPDGSYKVFIDSKLSDGNMIVADSVLRGESEEEILLSTYTCHPSMANNELSGMLVTAYLYDELKKIDNRYFTYRFVFGPETIGSIAYLSKFGEEIKENILGGFVITCVGDNGPFTFKKSKIENGFINTITHHVLEHHSKGNFRSIDFFPMGSDERQYSSPAFNFDIASLMRTMYGRYKEYHSSLDNKNFISFDALNQSKEMYLKVLKAIELNFKYLNLNPHGEPHLGSRGLYPSIGTRKVKDIELEKILYVLNYSDGNVPLIDIAKKMGLSILEFESTIDILIKKNLLKK